MPAVFVGAGTQPTSASAVFDVNENGDELVSTSDNFTGSSVCLKIEHI